MPQAATTQAIAPCDSGMFGAGLLFSSARHGSVARDLARIVVIDGRVDNQNEIAASLGLTTTPSSTAGLVLSAYDRWGDDCIARLDGDFTVLIWDEGKRHLIAGRDVMGVRPLYYHETPDAVYVASHPAAIIAAHPEAGVQDSAAFARFAAGEALAIDRTFYSHILRLEPACHLTFTSDASTKVRYFRWPSETRRQGADAPGRFAELLDRAVRRRMAGAAPVASFLSGGLDSSSVVAVAQRRAGQCGGTSLRTYSQVFPGYEEGDERPFIEAMIAEGGLDACFLDCTDIAAFDSLDEHLRVQAGPFIAPNLATTVYAYKKIVNDGFSTLLDGHGGDESISSGRAGLFDRAFTLRWLSLWREIKAVARLGGLASVPLMLRILRRKGPHSYWAHHREASKTPPRPNWLSDTLEWPLTTVRRPQLGRESHAEHLESFTSSFFVQALELLAHSSASQGVDLEFPLLDRELVSWCLAAPAEEKMDNGYYRGLLRRGMRGILPDKIRLRQDKHDFGLHIARGMLRSDGLLIDRILHDADDSLSQYFNIPVVSDIWRRIKEEETDFDGYELQVLWRAIVLGRWLEISEASAAAEHGGAGTSG